MSLLGILSAMGLPNYTPGEIPDEQSIKRSQRGKNKQMIDGLKVIICLSKPYASDRIKGCKFYVFKWSNQL